MFDFLVKPKTTIDRNKKDRERALSAINSGWPSSVDEEYETDRSAYPITDMPTKNMGGSVNLIRAVYDGAQRVIDDIDVELKEMEERRGQLIKDRNAHVEMLAVAQKFISN